MKNIGPFSHNWLAYKINAKCLHTHLQFIKGKVVDLGCGSAPYKETIRDCAVDYVGVDWGNSFHDISKVDIIANLTRSLPIRAESVDTVVSFQVLEHLPEPELFLRECFRILKPGGHLFITVPFMWHIHEEPYDYFRFTKFGLKYLLERHDFIDIKIKENTGFWQTWALKFNYHTLGISYGIWRYVLIPIWWLDQTIAPLLDKLNANDKETASYAVLAKKPKDS